MRFTVSKRPEVPRLSVEREKSDTHGQNDDEVTFRIHKPDSDCDRSLSRTSSPGGRRVTISNLVRQYSHSTSDLHETLDDSGFLTPSQKDTPVFKHTQSSEPSRPISFRPLSASSASLTDSESTGCRQRSDSSIKVSGSQSESVSSSPRDSFDSDHQSSEDASQSTLSYCGDSSRNVTKVSSACDSSEVCQESETFKPKLQFINPENVITPMYENKTIATKDFFMKPNFAKLLPKPSQRFSFLKGRDSGSEQDFALRQLANSIKIEISPPDQEEKKNEENAGKIEDGNTTFTDKTVTSTFHSLHVPGKKPRANRFNVVKVDSTDSGSGPGHSPSVSPGLSPVLNNVAHQPDSKSFLEESPDTSLKAGSDFDLESERGDERFSSLKRSYSRSSIASAMSEFREKFKSSLTGNKKKGLADNNARLKMAVIILFSICFGIVVTSHILYNQQVGEEQIFPDIKLLEEERRILVQIRKPDLDFSADLGVNLPHHVHPYDCLPGVHYNQDSGERCYEWLGKARLTLKRLEHVGPQSCYQIKWKALAHNISPQDCWQTQGSGNWYGGGERLRESWPLQKAEVKLSPFVTGDEDQTEWGNVIKRYFINSDGVSIRVSDETPLSVSMRSGLHSGLCLKAHYDEFPYYYHKAGYPELNYTVCTDDSLLNLYESQLTTSFWDGHKESDLQELSRLLKMPLWQLVAPEGESLTSNHVSKYIKSILGRTGVSSSEDSRGYLLLDSSWQDNMGDFILSNRLKNIERTVTDARLTLVLTLTPFVSTDSKTFNEGVEKGLFVTERKMNNSKDIPALTWYKKVPSAALLDITNNQTKAWIRSKLRDLVNEMPNVVFFVETGNAFHTPHYFEFEEDLYNPDLYKDLFISVAMSEVKVIGVSGASSKRPKAPAFVHLTPLPSSWESLRTIIPNILNLGVIGYPFISTGPVGGDVTKNGTSFIDRTSSNQIVPESELFIRWWQLATFMPQIHFTVPPSQYRNRDMAKVMENLKYVKENVVNPELVRFSQVAMENSAPVIRPLWMLDPTDPVSQVIGDEFLIGDKILVAPVLEEAHTRRDVYLPTSKSGPVVWKRGTDGTFFEGGQWLNNSLAPLHTVLYFVRQPDFARPGTNLA